MKLLQVVGYQNAGKTTLVRKIVRLLSQNGQRIGTLKRDAHGHDPEPEGADTRLHREAGARASVLVSDSRTLWVREQPTALEELLAAMEEQGMDAVILEGFKTAPYPKLVLLRGDEDAELLKLDGIVCVALRHAAPRCEQAALAAGFPVFHTDANQFAPLLEFVRSQLMNT